MRRLFLTLTLLSGLMLAASFLGPLHPAGDTLAVFRPLWAGVMALSALAAGLSGARRLGAVALILALGGSAPMILGAMRGDEAPARVDLTLYSKNLLATLADPAPLVADILETGADVVLLQEVSDSNAAILDLLRETYPHQHLCRFSSRGGIAVLSRWPGEAVQCSPMRGMAAMQVASPSGPVWAASIHLTWPWPYAQGAAVRAIAPLLEPMRGRVVIGGDFNMVPWGYAVRALGAAAGAQRIGPMRATIRVLGLGWPIDHVLTSGQGSTEIRPRLGSDHAGVVARIGF
ncbi:endonuclease/exonuclease/phosphatase family protein [Pararhodobacter sp.]|uniref:endonuclease/exonuclease/phosphatase family protein n=1 Tax=Pararhodobacter sp. TaxID=2127056 RepID=UPI002AFEBD24|nr:endonuclease/exonuclease/phosphatase family protein [Pararhodobacter sp.]